MTKSTTKIKRIIEAYQRTGYIAGAACLQSWIDRVAHERCIKSIMAQDLVSYDDD